MATEILRWEQWLRCTALRTNAMNYSITIKKNWNDAHNNKQLTMHNKYTNDDVDFGDCVAHNMHWVFTYRALFAVSVNDTHRTVMAQFLSAFTLPSAWSSMVHSLWFDFSLFFYFFLLSVTVFLFHLELFFELHYTIVMANLRCSAAEESEDTLNSFTSPTLPGPSHLGPHFVCATPDSVVCHCYLLFFVLFVQLLLLLFVVAFGLSTPFSHFCSVWPFQMSTTFFQLIGTFLTSPIVTKFVGIPPNSHGKTLLQGPTPLLLFLLLLLLCCCCCGCFQVADRWKANLCPLLTSQNVCTAFSAVWHYLCCCLYNLLLLVRMFVLFLMFVLLLLPLLGRRPLKNPPLPFWTFRNVKNNFTID